VDRLLNDIMKTRGSAPGGDCPDAEKLSAWADGTLYGADADGIEAHLADCERCQAVLTAFAATEPAVEPAVVTEAAAEEAAPVVVPFTPRPTVASWAIPLVIGAAAASLILYVTWPKPPVIAIPATSIARVTPVDQAPATTPATTPVIGPAPKAGAPVATSAPKPARTLAKASEPTSTPVVMAPPPAITLTPTPTASPSATPSPTPAAAATADLRVGRITPTNSGLMQTSARSDRNALSFITPLPDGGVEFGPTTDPVADVTLTPTRQGEASRSPLKNIRWRVMLSGIVQKTIDGGTTWTRIVLDPAVVVTTGASPSAAVCWLVGKAGAVLRSTDGGATFTRVAAPVPADLVSITATDARTATVSTADGRHLTTSDGGQTWRQ
jgi:hypothetical protein